MKGMRSRFFHSSVVVEITSLFTRKLPGIELSAGSLGQGLGVAVGCALNAKLEQKDYRVYTILGVGELDEGSVWEATPLVTTSDTPYQFGLANVIRYRTKKKNFIEAFQTKLSPDYTSEKEDLTLIACGPMVAEAMRAAYILKEEYGLEARILNIHTIKPIDKPAILKATEETGVIVTCEEHLVGGFGNIIAGVIAQNKKYSTPLLMDMIGVEDRFGESGEPWELTKVFGLTAEHIAKRAKELLGKSIDKEGILK